MDIFLGGETVFVTRGQRVLVCIAEETSTTATPIVTIVDVLSSIKKPKVIHASTRLDFVLCPRNLRASHRPKRSGPALLAGAFVSCRGLAASTDTVYCNRPANVLEAAARRQPGSAPISFVSLYRKIGCRFLGPRRPSNVRLSIGDCPW
jgi:hypothetical protein